MLYMSSVPCGDGIECNSVSEERITATSDHSEHPHTLEICTPFCTCSCCAASVTMSYVSKGTVPEGEFNSASYPLYNVRFYADVHNSIWQPPKLV